MTWSDDRERPHGVSRDEVSSEVSSEVSGGRLDAYGDEFADRRTADALRRALSREAAAVEPSGDGLGRIRGRTARPTRFPGWLVPLAAAVAGVVVIGGVGWTVLDDDPRTPVAADPGPSRGPATTDPLSGPDTPLTTVEGTSVAIPVYYVGAQPSGEGDQSAPTYKLFREFHPTTVDAAPDLPTRVELALAEMFAGTPLDADYDGSSWPTTASARSVAVDESSGVITVDLAGNTLGDLSVCAGDQEPCHDGSAESELHAEATIQQLVFTATAAASVDGFKPASVDILVDGEHVNLLGVDVSAPLPRETAAFRAAVWILSVDEGATLASPITVSGEANLYEGGPATWEVLDGEKVIESGTFETGGCCRWLPYEFDIDATLPPGSYVLRLVDAGGLGDPERAPYDSKSFSIEGPAE